MEGVGDEERGRGEYRWGYSWLWDNERTTRLGVDFEKVGRAKQEYIDDSD